MGRLGTVETGSVRFEMARKWLEIGPWLTAGIAGVGYCSSMARRGRDDFSSGVRQDLCDRVGGLCSRPDCRAPTKGPKYGSTKAMNIGRAAHIYGAAAGGPRFNEKQTAEERRSFQNGIWLCANDATEIDADEHRFSPDLLRSWKLEAEAYAHANLGRRPLCVGTTSPLGLIAIGPNVLAMSRVIRTEGQLWTFSIVHFVLGDPTAIRHFADTFAAVGREDCFVCIEAEGIGRMLIDAPKIDESAGIVVTVHVAAPLPQAEAREAFDVNKRGTDIAFDLSGDEPFLPSPWPLASGSDLIAQRMMILLERCKGGWGIGQETGSRVAEFYEKFGTNYITRIIAIEVIRLATVPYADPLLKRTYAVLNFVERVRSVRLLPTTSTRYLKAAVTLDVFGLQPGREFIVPVSTSTETLGPRPLSPSEQMWQARKGTMRQATEEG
jgi:hypothetical protein